ncbi:hypothetical protein COCCADRAFT_29257 [Bipolaris zeicola 26-R-13]|uniref:Uncharacterized protein n=1 Tax=Cochliobolus carbonum (strain 26-R-13) TaxID=930089 RepID=W6Y3W2_COCC2|nr:uncharacterized protein COCCADRAFT_29257 [Bipolaris zeicola 26-R-13]EUC29734.1 hypothetical protein COCCADRAFT_29257 [Bipolaris zeicola 26-R-13]
MSQFYPGNAAYAEQDDGQVRNTKAMGIKVKHFVPRIGSALSNGKLCLMLKGAEARPLLARLSLVGITVVHGRSLVPSPSYKTYALCRITQLCTPPTNRTSGAKSQLVDVA